MSINNISSNFNSVEHLKYADGQSAKSAGGHPGDVVHNQPPLASSMEEVAMMFSESFEKRSKSIKERTVIPRTLMKLEKIEQIYRLLAEDNDNLEELVEQTFSRQKKGMQTRDMLDLAGGDPARADLILQQAITRAMNSGDKDCVNDLKNCHKELQEQHGSEIRAGINTAHTIALFSQSPTQRQEIRNLYYNSILGKSSLANIFDALLNKFGETDFNRGFHTLLRAIADDVASAAPSRPSGQLNALYKDLSSCQRLSSILKSCRDFCEKLVAKGFPLKASATDMARQLINFSQNNFYARDLKRLVEQSAGNNISHQHGFLNGYFALAKSLPLVLWNDIKNRKSVLNLMARQMDELTRLEGKARPAV